MSYPGGTSVLGLRVERGGLRRLAGDILLTSTLSNGYAHTQNKPQCAADSTAHRGAGLTFLQISHGTTKLLASLG